MDIASQVLKVEGKTSKNNKVYYVVALSDGREYSTFEGELATRAQALAGQQVSARVEQNGNYWNLKDIAPLGQLPPMAMPASPGTSIPMAPATSPESRGGPRNGFSEEDKARITKLAVLAHATSLVGSLLQGAGLDALEEAQTAIEAVAKRHYGVARSHEAGAVTPTTPAEVAGFVNSELPGAVQVGATGADQSPSPQTPSALVDW